MAKLLRSLFEDAVQVGPPTSISNRTRRCCAFASVSTACCTQNILNEVRIAQALVLRPRWWPGSTSPEKRLPQDGRFNMKVRGRDVDVRMSTMPVQYGGVRGDAAAGSILRHLVARRDRDAARHPDPLSSSAPNVLTA